MTLADKITSFRIVLAPIFFIIYLFPHFFPFEAAANWYASDGIKLSVPLLWALFIISEITDMIDGMVARKRGEVSDFGKLFDPFADTLVQLSYFLCFVIDNILPVALLLIVLYREFGILFIRNLMLKKGVAMGARMGGKLKTVCYILTGILALLASSVSRLGLDALLYRIFARSSLVVFALAVFLALVSFADYVKVYRKTEKV